MSDTTLLPEIVRENQKNIGLLVAGYVGYVEVGGGSYPETPEWAGIAALAVVAAAFVGLLASGRIEDLFPETHGIYLQTVNSWDPDRMEVWELTEDEFAELEVVNGPLVPKPENLHESYEVFAYDEERNIAVGTWRKSKPASSVVGQLTVSGAYDEMRELRAFLESEARIGNALRQNLPGVVRELDAARLENQTRMMEPDLSPTFDGPGIDDVLQETLPDHQLPDRLKAQTAIEYEQAEEGEDGEVDPEEATAGISVEVSGDALSASQAAENGEEVNDG
jgi:hypothetical protein